MSNFTRPLSERPLLTTGDVSRLFGTATRTVTKWCDSGLLPHYKLPGSNDRRIRRPDLVAFARRHGLPVPPGLADTLLLVGCDHPAGWPAPAERAAGATQAAHWLGCRAYAAVLYHYAAGRREALDLGRTVQAAGGAAAARLVYLAGDDEAAPGELAAAGWAVLHHAAPPVDVLAALAGGGGR